MEGQGGCREGEGEEEQDGAVFKVEREAGFDKVVMRGRGGS